MLKGSLRHYSPFAQLLLSLIIVLGSFLLTMFAGSILAYFIYGVNIFTDTQVINIHSDTVNLSILKFYQSVYSAGMFIIPPFVLAYLIHDNTVEYLYLKEKPKFLNAFFATIIIVAALPMINFLAEINSYMQLPDFMAGVENWMKASEEQAKVVTEKFLVMNSSSDLWVNLLVIALIPAIGEELLFRGVIQRIFSKMTKNIHWGIIITAFLFAALHMQFYGLLPRMAMGILFGYLLIWSKNLWVPIIAHLMNNGLAVLAKYYISKGSLPKEVETVGAEGNFLIPGIISILLVLFLMRAFYRIGKRQA